MSPLHKRFLHGSVFSQGGIPGPESRNTQGCYRYGLNVLFSGLFVVILLVSGITPALSATFTVNYVQNRADDNPGDCICDNGEGLCSVNTAIEESNACPGTDTIIVPSGTHYLPYVAISDSVDISGAGSGTTILYGVSEASFSVIDTASASLYTLQLTGDWSHIINEGTLSMDSVTVSGVTTSGALINNAPIGNDGTLTISNSLIDSNTSSTGAHGGAIDNGGTLVVSVSTFSNNSSPVGCGGAIRNSGSNAEATITGSHFTGNSAAAGGVICNGVTGSNASATITIEQSSLTSNTATSDGGAIYQSGDDTNSIELINTTVSGNQAYLYGGGIFVSAGTIDIASSTVAFNVANADRSGTETGGGIYNAATGTGEVNLKNTILAKNTRLTGPSLTAASDCVGSQISGGYNLVGYNCGITPALGDLFGLISTLDPQLNPSLQDGFGTSVYHSLLSSSPAVDSGDFGGCLDIEGSLLLVDQLGDQRVRGFVCDMGSAESAYTAGRILTYPVDGLTTTEAGGSETVNIQINGNPSSAVTVGIASSDAGEGSPSVASVTFTSSSTKAQSFTVTGVNDDIDDGNVDYTITASAAASADSLFRGIDPDDISLTNMDDGDEVGITVSDTLLSYPTEGGAQDSFTLVLDSEPTADVTIVLESSDTTEIVLSPLTLVFTPANWDQPKTVTATGVDDDVDDGYQTVDIIVHPATSADLGYDGLNLPQSIAARNEDDDTAGMTLDPWGVQLVTSESGGQDSVTLVLDSEPTATVTVPVSSTDTSEVVVSPASLTFTSSNWSTPQVLTLTGIDDDVDDGNQVVTLNLGVASSTDLKYDGMARSLQGILNTNDDFAGVNVTPTFGFVTTEAGGQDSFTIVLTSEPTHDVILPSFVSDDTSEVIVTPSSMLFTPQNWNIPQTVTVTGVDDYVSDGTTHVYIRISPIESNDSKYSGREFSDYQVSNWDDDVPGILATPTSGLVTTEAGGQDSFNIVLTSEPTHDVTLPSIFTPNTSEVTVAPSSMLFTPQNWSTPQTVTVTGVDDDYLDGDRVATILSSKSESTDSHYLNREITVLVTNQDDEEGPAVFVYPYWSRETTETGDTDSFTVELNAAPSAEVRVALESTDISEGIVQPSLLTFTTTNWHIPQDVTITGVDDPYLDGDIGYYISTLPAQSSDSDYDGLNARDVGVKNWDDGEPDSVPGMGCDSSPVEINAAAYGDGDIILCVDPSRITAGTDVVVGDGSEVTYQAPVVELLPGFIVQGGVFHAGNE